VLFSGPDAGARSPHLQFGHDAPRVTRPRRLTTVTFDCSFRATPARMAGTVAVLRVPASRE